MPRCGERNAFSSKYVKVARLIFFFFFAVELMFWRSKCLLISTLFARCFPTSYERKVLVMFERTNCIMCSILCSLLID